jgi:methionyl aminopeptidase
MIILKSKADIEAMRAAGKLVARTLREVAGTILPGKTTPQDLDAWADRLIRDGGAPTFRSKKATSSTWISA